MSDRITDKITISAEPLVKTLLLTELVAGAEVEEAGPDHDRVTRELLARFGGHEIDTAGARLSLFDSPVDAVGFALAYHRALADLSRELGVELLARAGLHHGEILLIQAPPEEVAEGAAPFRLEGLARPLTARVLALAEGRQTLLTRGAFELARRAALGKGLAGPEVRWLRHGLYLLKETAESVEILEVGLVDFAPFVPPADSPDARQVRRLAAPKTPEAVGSDPVGSDPRSPTRNPFVHGRPVTEARRFFGRDEVARHLLSAVASGRSCSVVGERQIGKSSLLAFLTDPQVQEDHGLAARQTLVGALGFRELQESSPAELWEQIVKALEADAPDPVTGELLAAVARRGEVTFEALKSILGRLVEQDMWIVLLCDDFDLAVASPRFEKDTFDSLKTLADDEDVTYVVTSRLSLCEPERQPGEEARQKLRSPLFRILDEVRLGPFADREVAELLAFSLERTAVRFESRDVEWLGRVAGRHPYLLQLAAFHLYEAYRNEAGDVRGEALESLRREAGTSTDRGLSLYNPL